ncbi:MAG: hypothetical protein HY287_16495 [Planctomycetes bacterium]|nr:hypothetical protein [Planctomycetota bacterium]MBI3835926.1 hypothetical protein [Planctomycetota bacterium]
MKNFSDRVLSRLTGLVPAKWLVVAGMAFLFGCGTVVTQPDFPACIHNAAGDCILLDDVEPILNDSSLTADQKRAKLRELGIEDEQLINALINA